MTQAEPLQQINDLPNAKGNSYKHLPLRVNAVARPNFTNAY
jgi:hypothetical protein